MFLKEGRISLYYHIYFYGERFLPTAVIAENGMGRRAFESASRGSLCDSCSSSSSKRKVGKGSPYSITERRVPELIPVLAVSLQVM